MTAVPGRSPGALPPHPPPSLKDTGGHGRPPGRAAQPVPEPPQPQGLAPLGLRHTLAAPENPGQPQRCPTEKMARTLWWSHAAGERQHA